MTIEQRDTPVSCAGCTARAELDFDFTMAFQPIVDIKTKTIFAHEALIRGLQNEPAASLLVRVNEVNRYRFDQACRIKAVHLAGHLRMQSRLSINFLPNAVYHPETCIRATIEAARSVGFPLERIIFEVTESEKVVDHEHLVRIVREYKRLGLTTAIDDFGAGYAGLNLLAVFQPDLVKIDKALTHAIDSDKVRRAIVVGIVDVCHVLGCTVIAEGVETHAELVALRDIGISLFQGYYFARPAFQSLTTISPSLFEI